MPWGKTDALSERIKFVVEWERRMQATNGTRADVAEMCRMFGVSRQTGYMWIRRFQEAGFDLRAMEERSRRPLTNPRAVTPEVEDLIVEARRHKPRWGPVMLRAWLVERVPKVSFPSASCIGAILKRRGLTAPKRRARRGERFAVSSPFPSCDRPNDVWCMDFKGWFETGDGHKCYPFTLLDAHSRFLLRCHGLLEPNGEEVMRILDSAFREYGLPSRIRSDGGPPFYAAQSPASLSVVSIWLLRLGIVLECIEPAKPQQNGRLERFHRTLKLEVDIAPSIAPQRRAFDEFRRVYNFERPHSALDHHPPWTVYRRSRQKYPTPLLKTDGVREHLEDVDRRGFIRWRKFRVFIGEAFAYQLLALWPEDGTRWSVFFGAIHIGDLDEQAPTLFKRVKRSRGSMRLSFLDTTQWEKLKGEVSGMSVD